MSARIKCRREGPAGRTITVSGPLTSRTSHRLLSEIHELAARACAPITVDVSNLSYFDSISLTILLGIERIIERQRGCPVDIRGIDVATQRLTGLLAS